MSEDEKRTDEEVEAHKKLGTHKPFANEEPSDEAEGDEVEAHKKLTHREFGHREV